ncbi:MAG: hypothetical protein JNL72_14910, partial [Flavipsychrobacter sp.]|nr:hypothetical protein [Flavipsychrobacter sp.]
MKHGKFTLIIILLCGILFSAGKASAWGTDILVNPTSGYKYRDTRIAVAYDGTVYVGRLVSSEGNSLFQEWQVLKSVDNGATFTNFDGGSLSGSSKYLAFDMIVAGENATDFRVFVARSYIDTSTSYNEILLSKTTEGGSSSGISLSEASYTGNNRGFLDLSMATDSRDKNSSASPYSFSLSAVKANPSDSIIVWTDNVGSTNLKRRGIYGTVKYIKSVSAAIGS